MDILQVKNCFKANGYQLHHELVKVVEYSSPKQKRWVYLRKDSGLPDHIRIVIEPSFNAEAINGIPDVRRPKNALQHGSNMRRMPMRQNRGKDPIHYGIPLDLLTLDSLERVLRTYDGP